MTGRQAWTRGRRHGLLATRRKACVRGRDDRGVAAVLVLVLIAVLTTLALAGGVMGAVLVGQRRAATAADLAAIAAAEALGSAGGSSAAAGAACEEARRIAEANRTDLVDCLPEGLEVAVQVGADVRTVLGVEWTVPGRARAGPAGTAP